MFNALDDKNSTGVSAKVCGLVPNIVGHAFNRQDTICFQTIAHKLLKTIVIYDIQFFILVQFFCKKKKTESIKNQKKKKIVYEDPRTQQLPVRKAFVKDFVSLETINESEQTISEPELKKLTTKIEKEKKQLRFYAGTKVYSFWFSSTYKHPDVFECTR